MTKRNERQYSIGRPLQEVRLRNWPAGRVALIKSAISKLEDELNKTVATEISQPEKRELNLVRVPKIVDLSTRSGIQTIQVLFTTPRGITDLLFYEIQHDTNQNFTDPTTVQTVQTNFILNSTPGVKRFFRARTVNSRFQAGPWSDTSSGVTAGFNIVTTRLAEVSDLTTISSSNFDEWITVLDTTAFNYGGDSMISAHIGMTPREATPVANIDRERRSTVTGRFRLLIDEEVIPGAGEARWCNTSLDESDGLGTVNPPFAGPVFALSEICTFHSIVTPFQTLAQGDHRYQLQARIESSESARFSRSTGGTPGTGTSATIRPVEININLVDITEVVEDVF